MPWLSMAFEGCLILVQWSVIPHSDAFHLRQFGKEELIAPREERKKRRKIAWVPRYLVDNHNREELCFAPIHTYFGNGLLYE